RVRARRPPGAARHPAQPGRAGRRPAGHLGPGRALPAGLPGGDHLRPASGRQPGLPGRRAEARRPAGPRPRRAPAAPRRRPRPPTSPRPRRARGSGRARRAGWTRDRPLFRIPNPESRIPASAGGDPMSARDRLGGWVLPLSLLLALLLGLLPLHAQLQPLRPYWVAL